MITLKRRQCCAEMLVFAMTMIWSMIMIERQELEFRNLENAYENLESVNMLLNYTVMPQPLQFERYTYHVLANQILVQLVRPELFFLVETESMRRLRLDHSIG